MRFRYHSHFSNVDRVQGKIKDASVIQLGAAKGHMVEVDGIDYQVFCDEQTLQTVLDCITDKYKTGLKIKFNADTFDHGPGAIAGKMPVADLRIKDGKVLGTFEVLKSFDKKEYLFDLAEDQADTFGLSIDFDGDIELIDGKAYMRCKDIYAATVVDEPAANADGFFSALPDTALPNPKPRPSNNNPESMAGPTIPPAKTEPATPATMPSPDDISKLMASVSAIAQSLTTIQQEVAALKGSQMEEEDPDVDGMSDEEMAAEMSAAGVTDKDGLKAKNRKINRYRKNLDKPLTARGVTELVKTLAAQTSTQAFAQTGGKAMPFNAGGHGAPAGEANQTEFEKKVSALVATGEMTHGQATGFCIRKHPTAYDAHRKAKQTGGVVSTMRQPAKAAA